jgi:hypothetical protein
MNGSRINVLKGLIVISKIFDNNYGKILVKQPKRSKNKKY